VPTRALFYPHIHFRSRRWLRSSLLYYDEISRIVPRGFNADTLDQYAAFSSDPEGILEDIRELQDAGFVRDEAPTTQVTRAVADEFFDFATNNLTDPKRRAALMPQLSRRGSYTIHPDKVDPALLEILKELKLIHEGQRDSFSRLRIEPVTGGLYMLFLDNRKADKRPLVSDSSVFQSLLYAPIQRPPIGGDAGFRLAAAVFETVIPNHLEDLPLDALLRLKEDYSSDRERFQMKISELAKAVQSAEDERELKDAIGYYQSQIANEVTSLKDKLRAAKVSSASSLFSVSIPAYFTADWGLGLKNPIALSAAGAVALSASVLKYVLDKKAIERESPCTYLLSVSKRLNAYQLAEDIVSLNLSVSDDDDDDDDGRREYYIPPSS
jgi:hypothetical protein